MEREIKAARLVCAWLCLLDVALGAGALFAPRFNSVAGTFLLYLAGKLEREQMLTAGEPE